MKTEYEKIIDGAAFAVRFCMKIAGSIVCMVIFCVMGTVLGLLYPWTDFGDDENADIQD